MKNSVNIEEKSTIVYFYSPPLPTANLPALGWAVTWDVTVPWTGLLRVGKSTKKIQTLKRNNVENKCDILSPGGGVGCQVCIISHCKYI